MVQRGGVQREPSRRAGRAGPDLGVVRPTAKDEEEEEERYAVQRLIDEWVMKFLPSSQSVDAGYEGFEDDPITLFKVDSKPSATLFERRRALGGSLQSVAVGVVALSKSEDEARKKAEAERKKA